MGLETTLETMVVKLTAEGSQFHKTLDGVEKRMAASVEKISRLGMKMSLAITAPLAGIGAMGVHNFSSLDSAMTKSTAVMADMTAATKREMKELAVSLSLQTSTPAEKLAEAYYYLAGSGLDAVQSMKALATVEQFAAAGAFDIARATEMLYDAQAAFGMKTKDAEQNAKNTQRIADALVVSGTVGQATVAQMAEAMAGAAPSLRVMNKGVEEGAAILMAYAEAGYKGSEAATQMEIAMRELDRGIREQPQKWRELGVSVYDSAGNMLGMSEIIGQLERSVGKMSPEKIRKTMSEMGFESRSVKSILPLFQQSAAMQKWQKDMEKAGGWTQRVAEVQLQSFSNQLAILRNHIAAASDAVGSVLAPYILRLGEYVKMGTKWWMGMSDSMKEFTVIGGLIAAAIGPALVIFGKLGSMGIGMFLSPLIKAAVLLGGIFLSPFRLIGGALTAVGGSFTSLGRTAGMVMGVIARGAAAAGVQVAKGLGTALSYGIEQTARLVRYTTAAFPAMVAVATRTYTSMRTAAVQFYEGITGATYRLQGIVEPVFTRMGREMLYWLQRPAQYMQAIAPGLYTRGVQMIVTLAGQVRGAWQTTQTWMSTMWSSLQAKAVAATGPIRTAWEYLASRMAERSANVVASLQAQFARLKGMASVATSQVTSVFQRVWNLIPVGVRQAMGRVGSAMAQDAGKIAGYGRAAANAFVSAFRVAAPMAATAVRTSMDMAFRAVQAGARMTGRVIRSMGGGLMNLFNSFGMLASMASGVGGRLGSLMSNFAMFAMVAPIVFSIVGAFATWPVMLAAAVGAWATLTETGQAFVSWVWSGLQPIWNIISDSIDGIKSALSSGDFAMAGQIAMAGLKATFFQAMAELMEKWSGFARGLVEVFVGAASLIGKAFINTYSSIASGLLKMAQQKGVMGDIMAKVLGTDVRNQGANNKNFAISSRQAAYRSVTEQADTKEKELVQMKASGASPDAIAALEAEIADLRKRGEVALKDSMEMMNRSADSFAGNVAETLQSNLTDQTNAALKGFDDSMTNTLTSATGYIDNMGAAATKSKEELQALLDAQEEKAGWAEFFDMLTEGADEAVGEVTNKTEDMRKEVEKPAVVHFATDGVDALEAGSAAAQRALQAYLNNSGQMTRPVASATKTAVPQNFEVAGISSTTHGAAASSPLGEATPRLSKQTEAVLDAKAKKGLESAYTEGKGDKMEGLLEAIRDNTTPTREKATQLIPAELTA